MGKNKIQQEKENGAEVLLTGTTLYMSSTNGFRLPFRGADDEEQKKMKKVMKRRKKNKKKKRRRKKRRRSRSSSCPMRPWQ